MNIHEHGLTILLEDEPGDVMTEQVIREVAREYLLAKIEIDGTINEEVINEILGMIMVGAAAAAGAATKAAVGVGKLAYKGAKVAGSAAMTVAKKAGSAVASGAKGAYKAAAGVVGNVGDAIAGTFGGEEGNLEEVPKESVKAMADTAKGMKGLAMAADSVQTDFQNTIKTIQEPAVRDALVSAGETSMEELQTTVNNQLETITANIGAEYEKAKGEPMDPSALRQQAVLALGASVAKVVKDLAQ